MGLRGEAVQGGEGAVAEHALVAQGEGVAAFCQRAQQAVGAIVDVAVQRLAILAVVVVAQVGLQSVAIAEGDVVGQAQVVLLVDVFQLAVEVGGRQARGEGVGAAGEVQPVAGAARTVGAGEQVQLLVIGGFAGADLVEAAGGQAQPVDFLRGDLEAVEGADQLAGIVEVGHRQARTMFADREFRFRVAHLGGQRGATVVLHLLVLAVVVGQHGIRAAPTAAV
ncbi:hypothetical protein D3C80_1365080 [compost metagenome]